MKSKVAYTDESSVHQSYPFQVVDGSITTPKGFTAGGFHCGIKKKRPDLGAIFCSVPATAAAVYTTNCFQGAPIQVTKESLAVEGKLQVVLINSGIANTCTGKQGIMDAYAMRREAAEVFGVEEHLVGINSTGWIGRLLPMDTVLNGIKQLPSYVSRDGSDGFNRAILTTDTFAKTLCVKFQIDGKEVTLSGSAKGSGMIHPNMATMLGFITTDAEIEHEALNQALKWVTNETYNMITVDGDTSTNDMVVVMASGLAGNHPLHVNHPEWHVFMSAFLYVSQELSKMIARDGEGATKLIEVTVKGALTKNMARSVAKSVVGSNLVKSAIYGADGNWGRIMAAIGYSNQPINPNQVDICVGDIPLVKESLPLWYDEDRLQQYLRGSTISIEIHLNLGHEQATAWGCDLTYEYVRINASYRT
ncbi:bifunctional glutamate N-acetyltransferase/amino-acid acetyltransferase ArgJ [Microaerobacter geothermalis]|uniref:bifunctional glutamate N-acetyltransferase/amino-acid acetyltransferase ArgJ n=1 Tax=Microaerobacter geothermalis TaxID=674972 RepID=UPI001F392C2E|nr:bifunctional glutamate N-acetyltransferase/amino-acid acetyltransferase ArgJ [Microaerobacter geothermalis]MCF6093444.1 bifunctional glutamate N-acetyltransferase/amino-acid acetyltransferase ArgJ [Microaerobacter geothermalis]